MCCYIASTCRFRAESSLSASYPAISPVAYMISDAGEEAADRVAGGKPARGPPGHEPAHLDHDLERGADGEAEEQHADDVVGEEAADPGAEDRRGPGDQRRAPPVARS